MRGATKIISVSLIMWRFQSTRPVRGATMRPDWSAIFSFVFQSTRPVRGATALPVRCANYAKFQSTRPVRGARQRCRLSPPPHWGFNPRAPCGARLTPIQKDRARLCFNPRAPCGARHGRCTVVSCVCRFQSTRPVRGATLLIHNSAMPISFQSTRPVRGATRVSFFVWIF